jgi:hypothetical protein
MKSDLGVPTLSSSVSSTSTTTAATSSAVKQAYDLANSAKIDIETYDDFVLTDSTSYNDSLNGRSVRLFKMDDCIIYKTSYYESSTSYINKFVIIDTEG